MSDRLYTVSELLQLNETSIPNNFKPVMGDGVKRSGNENEKAVKDIIKNVKEFNSVEGIDDENVHQKYPLLIIIKQQWMLILLMSQMINGKKE